jgi:hypothetical protein
LVLGSAKTNQNPKKKMSVFLCYDVILYIGEFQLFVDRISPTNKRIVKHHLIYGPWPSAPPKNMCLYSWCAKKMVFTYLKMFGPVNNTWLTWKRFGMKQLQITRRTRNFDGKLSWKESVFRKMTWGRCQGCGKTTQSVVFGTALCGNCRVLPLKTNCYMITTEKAVQKAKRRGVPAALIKEMPFYRLGQCKLRFNVEVNKEIARFELEN